MKLETLIKRLHDDPSERNLRTLARVVASISTKGQTEKLRWFFYELGTLNIQDPKLAGMHAAIMTVGLECLALNEGKNDR